MNVRNEYPALYLVVLLLISCGKTQNENVQKFNPYGHIKDEKVKTILKRAIDKAGGIDSWNSINTLSYTKHSVLLLEDSTVESDVVQRHEYKMKPSFEASISWTQDGEDHAIFYSAEDVMKTVNGEETEAEKQSLTETVMSAIYVLGMPFKLLDAGAYLTYSGTIVTEMGREADVIKATYDPAEHENHSTSDEWYYYFDVTDGTFLGCMVYHAPTYAYIQNLEFDETSIVKLHAHRKSYRSDSARNIQFLRAEFRYSDYEVTTLR